MPPSTTWSLAGVAQIVGVRARRRRVVADDQRGQDAAAGRVDAEIVGALVHVGRERIVADAVSAPAVIRRGRIVLLGPVDLEDQARRREHVRRQMRRVGVAHDHRGEGVVLHLAEQMQAVEPLQVVEAVAVLQLLHLHSRRRS